MKKALSFLAGCAAGSLLMFFLDARSGARRRALVRDKLVATGHGLAQQAETQGRRTLDRLRGLAATRRLDRVSHRPPDSDVQLQERIRSRLGHFIEHPRTLHVEVEDGCVRLTGRILRRELRPLLREVEAMAGVRQVRNLLDLQEDAGPVRGVQADAEGPAWPVPGPGPTLH